ncbi:hypothetical protein GCM10010106_31280 [Thermopolyspora flexuosa]|jgi:serine/threonine protein kinase|uniref:serine/threonine-protein kinase n=1 Tax=Thermopolyspora flexuosa TaxID=103836 RepID=UPI00115458E4|nr:serine/threonine-protein kinase [Thermopolyspora flexuosa]GGM82408.1 hypothetical protein GCM10010106_31280 [Thermopolyspora flexuosa]
MPLRAGDPARIGGYTLLGCLGEGGMGTVYLGADPAGRPVAVKLLRREYAADPGLVARFRAEVAHTRRVVSPHTARVLGSGVTGDGRPYLVTEYIEGISLAERVGEAGPLEPALLLETAYGTAAALAAIHAAGLVHRDLKPANVILSAAGPRVIDFGIARALRHATVETLTGEVVGSPGWWAPEQVTGGEVTPAADIFAWGCLVAYAASGIHPFGEGDPLTMAERVVHADPRLGHLPRPLDHLVRRALSRSPAPRPTAPEIVHTLADAHRRARWP